MATRSYSDERLAAAVASAHSWRGVLRDLGLSGTSAGSLRSVRRHADRLGISYTHFTGQRRWADSALAGAVGTARSWTEAATSLGLAPSGGTIDSLRAHALRLRLDTEHLVTRMPEPARPVFEGRFSPTNLHAAGSLFAATWFALRGGRVAWPLEPCRYDLVADVDGITRRVQVKTTTQAGPGAVVSIANSRRTGRAIYAPGEIDDYFLLDVELTAYLVPYEVVAGFERLQLGRYAKFVVAERGGLIGTSSPAPAPRSRSGCR